MNKPLVSIVIPCYNQGKFLSDTLSSVLNQTYQNFECIVVNDGSTDNTEEVAVHFVDRDARFIYVNKKNGGLSSARNAGLLKAKGEFIQLLDSDDLIAVDKLLNQVAFLLQNVNVDVAYSGSRYFENTKPGEYLIFGRNNFLGSVEITMHDTDVLRSVLIRNPFVVSAPLFRKRVFEKVGYFDENLSALEDWDFQIRCAASKLVFHYLGFHPDTATFIRLHDSSMMRKTDVMQKAKLKLFKKHAELDVFQVFPKPVNNVNRMGQYLSLITPPFLIGTIKKIRSYFQ